MTTGEFGNVQLSEQEHIKLLTRFGASVTAEYVEKLSCWLKATGKRRKSHYATILTWLRKDLTLEAASQDEESRNRVSNDPDANKPLLADSELYHRAEIMQQIRAREGWPYLTVDELVARLKETE